MLIKVKQAHLLHSDPNALSRTRLSDGAFLRYDVENNIFGPFTPERVPKTLFKPGVLKPLNSKYANPLEYFYGQ